MTTTSSTTSTTSTQSVTSAAASSLLTSLDAGSGVDTASLVKGLVEAQFAAKTAALTARSEKLTAQISAVSTIKSNVTDFASALENLVKGGTLASQPTSSNTGVLGVSALTGAKLYGLTASVTVSQLAAAQTAVSGTAVASKDAAIGTGQFTLTLGTATYGTDGSMASFTAGSAAAVTIDITSTNNSLTGIAAAINAKKAGVTASVVTDVDGKAFLSLKGATGAASAFTLQATTDDNGTLAAYNVDVGATGMAISSQAKNAKLTVDGVAVERASNTVTDVLDGVKLDLLGTSTVAANITASTPTSALTNAVSDFVETYNGIFANLKTQLDPITGDLRADTAAQTLFRTMRGLTTKTLVAGTTGGAPSTLAEIGVATNRDGTLSVNSDTLTAALKNNPAAVEAIFAFSQDSVSGLNGAMQSLKLSATSTLYGLGASNTRYNEAKSDLAEAQDKLTDQSDKMSTRLTQQFASMNARVAAYKSTMTFMENQIKAWNNSNN